MKDVVLINNFITISESLMDLTDEFNLLMERYRELKERNDKLNNEFEIIISHKNYQSNEQ